MIRPILVLAFLAWMGCALPPDRSKPMVVATRVNGRMEVVRPCPTLAHRFFITQDEDLTYEDPQLGMVLRPEKIEAARQAADSRPASEDPSGNWGKPAAGFQLSARFEKATFGAGEPIVATVIFRNVSNVTQYAPANIPRFDAEILIRDEAGKLLEERKPADWDNWTDFQKRLHKIVQNPKYVEIIPRAQRKYQVALGDFFDLKPGQTYQVQVRYRVKSGGLMVDATSGIAPVKIIAAAPQGNAPAVYPPWRIITYPDGAALGSNNLSFVISSQKQAGFDLGIQTVTNLLQKDKLSVRLHRAGGEIVLPQHPPWETVAQIGRGFGISHHSIVTFPWSSNVLEEAWIEVAADDQRVWLEIPYGFTCDPAAPPAPSNRNGNAKLPAGLAQNKNLRHLKAWHNASYRFEPTESDIVLHWRNVHYDVGEIQNGWRLELHQSSGESEVILYREGFRSWETNAPRTAMRIRLASGQQIEGECRSIRLHEDRLRRSDVFKIPQRETNERSWGIFQIEVDQKRSELLVPSSLFQANHGHAD